jgi:hypothetical protein
MLDLRCSIPDAVALASINFSSADLLYLSASKPLLLSINQSINVARLFALT